MTNHDIESKMKRLEVFHGHRVIEDSWFVVRLDGRNFSKLTKKEFKKPFDPELQTMLAKTTATLVDEFACCYAFAISDEISLLFKKDFKLFDRQVEKIVSLTAAAASSEMTLLSQKRIQFDSRIVVLPNETCVAEYFRWRQDDGFRNALSDLSYWTLVKSGMSEERAQQELNGKDYDRKITLLLSHNVNFMKMPHQFRRGAGFVWETFEKEGFNPKLNQPVKVKRRRITQINELPCFDAYGQFVISQLSK